MNSLWANYPWHAVGVLWAYILVGGALAFQDIRDDSEQFEDQQIITDLGTENY